MQLSFDGSKFITMAKNISISDFANTTRETFNIARAAGFVDVDSDGIVRLAGMPRSLREFRNSLHPLPSGLVTVEGIMKTEEQGLFDIELSVASGDETTELDIIVGGWRGGVVVPSGVYEANDFSVDETFDKLIDTNGRLDCIDDRVRNILSGIFHAIDDHAIQTVRDRV